MLERSALDRPDRISTPDRIRDHHPGVNDRDVADIRAATAEVSDADVDAMLDREGVTPTDTVETPELIQDARLDRIRSGEHVAMRGHTGEPTEAIQEQLVELGYLNPESNPRQQVDGIFGTQTQAAVERFQEAQGLEKIDGIVGTETLAALEEAITARRERRPEAPTTLEERAEVRDEIVSDITTALGVQPATPAGEDSPIVAPAADGAVNRPGAPTAPEAPAAAAAISIDPSSAAPPEEALDALGAAIRPGDPNVEPAILEAVGGPEGLAAGIDASLEQTLVPERFDDAMYLAEQELATPDTVSTAPIDPQTTQMQLNTLRTQANMAVQPGFFGIQDPEALETVLVNASNEELDAMVAADPAIGMDMVSALRRSDPEYAQMVGRYFGSEADVARWMDVAPPTPAEAIRGGRELQ